MNREGRPPNYTKEQFDKIWRLYKSGHRLWDISQKMNINPGSIHIILHRYGGIAPYRRRPRKDRLSLSEREEISRGIACGKSMGCIAERLERPVSTISREVGRNGGTKAYRAALAQRNALANLKRPKPCKLDTNERLRDHIIEKLKLDWSPEQIAGELPLSFPDDESMRISHETIYRTIFIQARGSLEKELRIHLRTKRKLRKSRASAARRTQAIRQRPAKAKDRAILRHGEGDLVLGTIDSQVATLVERTSRFLMLVRLESKFAPYVSAALARHVKTLPVQLKRSLTCNRGSEMADHKRFTIDTGVQVYFCDPKSPWQRKSNENTNGLLRQYLPRGKNLSGYTQEELDEIAMRLNTRPRKTLGFMAPAAKLEEVLR